MLDYIYCLDIKDDLGTNISIDSALLLSIESSEDET